LILVNLEKSCPAVIVMLIHTVMQHFGKSTCTQYLRVLVVMLNVFKAILIPDIM